MINIQPIIENCRAAIASHELAPGKYARWIRPNRDHSCNPYGCADAANLLCTIGDFPRDGDIRRAFVETLQAMQDPETGLFHESTHHEIHTTAHCIAALQLFDARPLHKLTAFAHTNEPGALESFLDNCGWMEEPTSPSGHLAAGIYAAMVNAGEASPEWCRRYYRWFWDNADPKDGMWRKGDREAGSRLPDYMRMGSSFHFLFNLEHGRQPLRYPERLIDSCLAMLPDMPDHFWHAAHFLQVDWVYCLTRAARQTPYRFEEIREAVRGFAKAYTDFLLHADWQTNGSLDDLHLLFGTMCCMAELQQFLRGEIVSDYPLHLVLDRRPFI